MTREQRSDEVMSAEEIGERLAAICDEPEPDARALGELRRTAESELGVHHPLTWEVTCHHATAVAHAGNDVEGLESLDVVLARAQRDDPAGTAATRALEFKAALLSHLDRDDEAAALWEQVVRQWRIHDGERSARVLTARFQFSRTLAWSGELDRALGEIGAVLADSDHVWSPYDPPAIDVLTHQARLLRSLDRLEQSIEVYRRILARRLVAQGADHPRTLRVRKHIAIMIRDKDGPEEALRILEDLAADTLDALGPTHNESFDVAEEVAYTLSLSGEHRRADTAYRHLVSGRTLIPEGPYLAVAVRRWTAAITRVPDDGSAGVDVGGSFQLALEVSKERLATDVGHLDAMYRRFAGWLAAQHRHADAVAVLREAEPIAGQLGSATLLDVRHHLARSLRSLGRVEESIEVLRHALTEAADLDPERRRPVEHSLAMTLSDIDRGAEAIELFRRRAPAGAEVSIEDAADLAVIFVRDERYSDAIAVLTPHAATAVEHGRVGLRVLGNLALALCGSGSHQRALAMWAELSAAEREQNTSDITDIHRTRHNMAREYGHVEDFTRAISEFDQVIAERRARVGPESPDTLTSMSARAYVFEQMGDLAEAIRSYREVWELRRRVLGDNHPSTADSARDLGDVLARAGDTAGLEEVTDAALAGLASDGDSPAAAGRNAYLRGVLLKRRDRTADSLVEFRRATELLEQSLGAGAPATITARKAAADAVYGLGQYADAVRAYRVVLPFLESEDRRQDQVNVLDRFSTALQKAGAHAEAMDALRHAYDLAVAWAPDDRNTLRIRSNLGRRLAAQGDHDAAESIYRALATDRERVLGPDDRLTLDTRSDVAETLLARGDARGAKALFATLVPHMERVLGPDDRDTVRARGKHAEAVEQASATVARYVSAGIATVIAVILVAMVVVNTFS
ncbi:tetratricopeptide repeat protein [Williamsia sp. CHRR-6]|uniref:tetratricopeptide repeat protein n=1 Tax=Williamsia sp. CHRR-6 TaxID=2835871 RepID=UPI001BDB08F7|nr:tetratricopeptide repeat protein [Williamsia sp. CHRR-6]MBT0567213.1 tetratricopeptide repeat protein [Williamsia sp. CHRR-6]